MPKNKKTTPKSYWNQLKDKWRSLSAGQKKLAMLALVILIPFLGYQSWKYYHVFRERHYFNIAEEQLLELQDEIIATVGEPTSKEFTKSCGYASAKFTRGQRTCGEHFSLHYEDVITADEAARLADLASDSAEIVSVDSNAEFKNPVFPEKYNGVDSSKDFLAYGSYDSIKCIGYVSYAPTDTPKSQWKKPTGLYINAGCSISPAHTEHFPVNDD